MAELTRDGLLYAVQVNSLELPISGGNTIQHALAYMVSLHCCGSWNVWRMSDGVHDKHTFWDLSDIMMEYSSTNSSALDLLLCGDLGYILTGETVILDINVQFNMHIYFILQ